MRSHLDQPPIALWEAAPIVSSSPVPEKKHIVNKDAAFMFTKVMIRGMETPIAKKVSI